MKEGEWSARTNKGREKRKKKKQKKKYLESIHDLALTFGVPEARLHFEVLKMGDWWAGEARAELGESYPVT